MVSAFVSGSELAFFSLTPEQFDSLEDNPRYRNAVKLLEAPERLLATVLIANNLVNVTIVILCNYAFGAVFDNMSPVLSFILQTIILTFLILLFGEILPKLIANSDNLRWIRISSPVISLLKKLFYPVSSVLVKSTVIVNRVVSKKETDVTPEDLEQALEITDLKSGEEKNMLEGILKFGDTTASEVMTPRVDMVCIFMEDSFDKVLETVVESGYARIPVCGESDDDIKGILFSRDLLPYIGKENSDFDWHKLLREPYFVPESRMIDDLLEDFRKRRVHMAVVVDEFGGTQGIVTMEDVLEEIVGDIDDEYDDEAKTYRKLQDNTYIFEGKTLLGDFFRVTGLDEEDYSAVTADCETLAGMLLAIKGDFPKEKEPLVYGRCRFLILDIHGHRIASVRVKVMPEIQTL
ncbi:MAG: gliding motility-associated protein GldE [Paramuribaculum sp.]|nr:gliding motility-associated protein GldE [Paramuribaculum sp.]